MCEWWCPSASETYWAGSEDNFSTKKNIKSVLLAEQWRERSPHANNKQDNKSAQTWPGLDITGRDPGWNNFSFQWEYSLRPNRATNISLRAGKYVDTMERENSIQMEIYRASLLSLNVISWSEFVTEISEVELSYSKFRNRLSTQSDPDTRMQFYKLPTHSSLLPPPPLSHLRVYLQQNFCLQEQTSLL